MKLRAGDYERDSESGLLVPRRRGVVHARPQWMAGPGFFGSIQRPWTPAQLQTPYWMDDSASITVAGTKASTWSNIGALGGAVGQATASAQPTIVANGLNSLRTLQWDGVDDVYFDNSSGARAIFQNATGAFAFAVVKRLALDATATQRNFINFTNNSTSSRFLGGMSTTTSGAQNKPYLAVRRLDTDTEGLLTSGTATPDTSYHMYLWMLDLPTRTGTIWRDGINTDINTALTTAGSNFSNTASACAMSIGAFPNATGANPAANGFGNLELAALVIGGFSLLAALRQKLEGWAAWRYSLTSLLPSYHPFKAAAPTI